MTFLSTSLRRCTSRSKLYLMNKNQQIIALIITLCISALSVLLVYDTLTRFSFQLIIHNIFNTVFIHTVYVLLILILSFPALRFNLLLIQKKSYLTNKNLKNELLDSTKSESLENRKFKIAWKLNYLFSILFLFHPVMLLLIVMDNSMSINNPFGIIITTLINIVLGLYLIINSRKTKEIKWL